MTTPFYSSDCAVGSGVQPRANLGLCSVSGTYSPTTILLTGDVIHMVKIPAGATTRNSIRDAKMIAFLIESPLRVGGGFQITPLPSG